MKNKALFFSSILVASVNAFAAKVVQINGDSVVISTEELKTESAKSFVIDLGQGEQCIASLKSAQDGHLLLDTNSCANKDKIRAGQAVSTAIVFNENPPAEKPEYSSKEIATEGIEGIKPKSRKFNFAITPSAILSGTLNFPTVTIVDSGTVYTGNIVYDLEQSLSLRLDATQSDKNSFNSAFGLGYEGSRNLGKVTSKLNGTNYSGKGSGKVSSSFIFAGGSYRWDIYYIGLGILSTSVASEGLPLAVKNLKGGIGADFYMGWYLENNIALEFSSKSTTVTTETLNAGGTSYSLTPGHLGSISFGIKFLFL